MTETNITPWIEEDFKDIDFKDKRLIRRFKDIINKFIKNAQSNISSTFNNWASIKACYRFFDNTKVKAELILNEHIKSSISRINNNNEVSIVIHDTSYIDYKTRKKSKDLDRVFSSKNGSDGCFGLILHNSLAITTEGIPLGLLNQQFTRRETILHSDRKMPTKQYVHTKPIEEKESYRWIEAISKTSNLGIINEQIHVADREGDIYELYRDCDKNNIKFVVRARLNRAINKEKRRGKTKEKLFEYFEALPIMFNTEIKLQINNETKYRTADLSVSFEKFTLPPPPNRTKKKDGDNLNNILLWGIYVREKKPPTNEEGLSWFLITNIPISTNEEVIEKIKWYTLRWNIEIFHKILKSGCSVELAQLRNRDRLIKYITVKSIVAWKIFWLSRNFNINKNADCSTVLNFTEQMILFKRFNKGSKMDRKISITEAFIWIAKLGGYIGRKADLAPGIITIWRGWTRFMNMVEDYKILSGETYG
jgi:hypothetical protein